MKAKSNQPFPVQAFVGLKYVPGEWRDVPEEFEEEARKNPYLILDTPTEETAEVEPAAELSDLSRKELQARAKEAGIPANQTDQALIDALTAAGDEDE